MLIFVIGQIWYAVTIYQRSLLATILSFIVPMAAITITYRNWQLLKKPYWVCLLGYVCIFSGAMIANSFRH
ncbi:MAG TPA: hypothetical protein DIW81_16110 [Planctomycetaceae bacterium]|nr:hypothetical protein [Rubinisphaera sp.]HCS53091.1 hypothetical protein [Planctomycetaceae bacterium]